MTPLILHQKLTMDMRRNRFAIGGAGAGAGMIILAVTMHARPGPMHFFLTLLAILLIAGGLAIGLWAALRKDEHWTLDRQGIVHASQSLMGERTQTWAMREVDFVAVRTLKWEDSPDTYRVDIRLKSGRVLKLPPDYKAMNDAEAIKRQIISLKLGD